MAIGVRNGGSGLALIHGWRIEVAEQTSNRPPSTDDFRRQQPDIYIPAGETGYWQGAIRDRSDPAERDDYLAEVGRYWNIDGIDPRDRPDAPPDLSP